MVCLEFPMMSPFVIVISLGKKHRNCHLPCKYCPRAYNQWSRFNDEVDVVPLAIKSVKSETQFELPNKWLQRYTNDELKEAQTKDTNLQKLITWISDREPEQKQISICSPQVKYFYLNS